MKKLAFVLLCLILLYLNLSEAKSASIADSYTDFSSLQGYRNWSYGFYDGDSSHPYSPDDFEYMTNFISSQWWVQRGEGGYWTTIGRNLMHPNGLVTSYGRLSAEQWPVLRWTSTVNGPITITGNIADLDSSAGDGVIGYIFVDGACVFQQSVVDLAGINYNVVASVNVGSFVDFAISPGLASNDWTDSTSFRAVITPEPTTLLLLTLGGVILRRRK